MIRMKLSTLVVASAVAVAAAGGTASADQWCLTYDGYGANTTVGVNYDASKSWNAATRTTFSGVKVGEHLFQQYGNSYSTFCIQLFEGITAGSTVCFDVVGVADVPDSPPAPGPMGELKATLVQDLYHRFYSFAIDVSQDVSTRNLRCAAFGLALYEISHENLDAATAAGALGQLSLELGAFQADENDAHAGGADAFDMAASMLAALGIGGFHSFGDRLLGLTNPTKQDQLVVVPLPAVAGLALAGLIGGGLLRRRLNGR